MDINIIPILKKEGASLNVNFSGNVNDLESRVDSYNLVDPVIFKGTLQNRKGVLNLKGLIKFVYDTPCYRCLNNIHGSMEIPVKEDILNAAKVTDEDDAFTYEGDYLNIDRILKDYIILNLPMKQICREDCKGLCPVCGINLNNTICSCAEEKDINPKMEILKKYFE
ncbi:MAG TPA: DUF177 domain-containing protein [Clostridiales bacterium]|nr:DUF177 domain-containing protein [Clostridiales bacterium]